MFSLLLKKALPFTLTLVVGVAVGTLFKSNSRVRTWMEDSTPMLGGRHEHYHSCPMGRRYLVAETKPLAILNVPDARWPRGVEEQRSDFDPVRVLVRFGANGKVGEVTALESR